MVSAFTEFFAAKLKSTIRVISLIAIFPTFATGPLESFLFKPENEEPQEQEQEQEQPVRNFFFKSDTDEPKPKRRRLIRDFFLKNKNSEQDAFMDEGDSPSQYETEEEDWECDSGCDCCN